jgi:hypothetical protein
MFAAKTGLFPLSEGFQWIGSWPAILSFGTAATVQGGTVLARLPSSIITAGTGNVVVATGEHAAASGTSGLSLFIPLVVAFIAIIAIFLIILKFRKKLYKRDSQ